MLISAVYGSPILISSPLAANEFLSRLAAVVASWPKVSEERIQVSASASKAVLTLRRTWANSCALRAVVHLEKHTAGSTVAVRLMPDPLLFPTIPLLSAVPLLVTSALLVNFVGDQVRFNHLLSILLITMTVSVLVSALMLFSSVLADKALGQAYLAAVRTAALHPIGKSGLN